MLHQFRDMATVAAALGLKPASPRDGSLCGPASDCGVPLPCPTREDCDSAGRCQMQKEPE